jgi:hypothetical protein
MDRKGKTKIDGEIVLQQAAVSKGVIKINSKKRRKQLI